MTLRISLAVILVFSLAAVAAAGRPVLGVSYPGWRGEYRDASRHLEVIRAEGFRMVSFVPTYAYVGLNRIDTGNGPTYEELRSAITLALRSGLAVVLKPHLDPPLYEPGNDPFTSENHSWRANTPWRGFFDVDPMSSAYREGIIMRSLRMLSEVFDSLKGKEGILPVRLELGAELMNSVVSYPGEWERLLARARREIRRLGIRGKVLLSHNFSHHFEMPEDVVLRMGGPGRAALARYIRGLDALALSQYMDLTILVPRSERRLPAPEEIASALLRHEREFRDTILIGYLGLRPDEIPPLHIGEFGIGRGGLRHPNLWAGETTAGQKKQLMHEVALGMEGLVKYLALGGAGSAVLWVTGGMYDVFGWMDDESFNGEAIEAIRNGLR